MAGQKYIVRLVRPVFQATYVEIEAKSENEAAFNVYQSAASIPAEQWRGRYNPDAYQTEAYCVRTLETTEGNAFSLLDFPEYCVISTDISPIGSSTIQPWMDERYPWLVASYMSEWITSLIEERVDVYDEVIEFFEEELRSLKGTDEKVVPLKPPAELRANIELIEASLDIARLLKEVD